jgi:hypothetical protein
MYTASMHAGNSTQFLSAFGGTGSYHYQPISLTKSNHSLLQRGRNKEHAIEEETKARLSEPEDNMVASSSDEENDA